ncbi:autotransporter domain-containing protein [Desulfovibrio sp. OttesenSCG-928-C14]|nr:autotransporter domain-containing protein [Desulfovibrio sp. OttesenSCG-928-C14]
MSAPAAKAGTVSVFDYATLKDAVTNAVAGDSVVFTPGASITVDGTWSPFAKGGVSFIGNGATIDLAGKGQLFLNSVDDTDNQIKGVSGLTLLNGTAARGGAIQTSYLEGVADSRFIGNSASSSGGAIYVISSFTGGILNSEFSGNQATGGNGGAITATRFTGGSIVNSVFSNNISNGSGGAIYLGKEFVGDIIGSSFTENWAKGTNGGAIRAGSFTGNIVGSSFDSNRAGSYGAGIYVANAFDGVIQDSTFSNNFSSHRGAALAVGGTFTGSIINSIFEGNYLKYGTAAKGGAIYVGGAMGSDTKKGYIIASSFLKNSSSHDGGALYLNSNFTGDVISSHFEDNVATGGAAGAMFVAGKMVGDIVDSSFIGNKAKSRAGGAVRIDGGLTGNVDNSVFKNNETTGGSGGAMYITTGWTGNAVSSEFSGNKASGSGGAVYASAFSGNLSNSVFSGNTAGNFGGALYVNTNFVASVDAGATTVFSGNRDGNGLNSIYFNNDGGGKSAEFKVDGTLYLFDPLKGGTAGLKAKKSGNGLMVLGGKSSLPSEFTVDSGTLRLTFDWENGAAGLELGLGGKFTLSSSARLELVPQAEAITIIASEYNFASGNAVALGNDYRYAPAFSPEAGKVVADFNGPSHNGALNVASATRGTFSVGQYDYAYSNLRYDESDNKLKLDLNSVKASPERNGAYGASAALRGALANPAPAELFAHAGEIFKFLRKNMDTFAAGTSDVVWGLRAWGQGFYNYSTHDAHGGQAKSTLKVPGFIMGMDKELGQRAFLGVAVSAAWPDYTQGHVDIDGYDLRVIPYAGVLLPADIELAGFISAGTGTLDQTRRNNGYRYTSSFDVDTYSLGLSLAKAFELGEYYSIKPFASYEYIHTRSHKYTEEGGDLLNPGIHASKHSEQTSRVKLGVSGSMEMDSGLYLKGELYYQALFGDRNASVSSYLTTNPDHGVSVSGTKLDRNSVGAGLTAGYRITDALNISGNYNIVTGKDSTGHSFGLRLDYRF